MCVHLIMRHAAVAKDCTEFTAVVVYQQARINPSLVQ
jgi:hypothetical protein